MSQSPSSSGVVFPTGEDGKRSTTATGRAVWADAVREVDPALAARIDAAADWRRTYVANVVDVTATGTRSPSTARTASAQTARPVAVVLRRPSSPVGKTTPDDGDWLTRRTSGLDGRGPRDAATRAGAGRPQARTRSASSPRMT